MVFIQLQLVEISCELIMPHFLFSLVDFLASGNNLQFNDTPLPAGRVTA